MVSILHKFPQMDHRPKTNEGSKSSQVPVFVLGGKGGLHHPVWIEGRDNSLENVTDDSDDEASDLEETGELKDDVRKTVVPNSQPPVESQSDYELSGNIPGMEDRDEGSVKTPEVSGPSSTESEEDENSEDERTVDKVDTAIPASHSGNKNLTLQRSEITIDLPSESATGTTRPSKSTFYLDLC